MIESYYMYDCLSEPKFCVLLHDILRLQKGNPIREFPYTTDNTKYALVPF